MDSLSRCICPHDDSGRVEVWKVSSTPDDPSLGIASGLAEAIARVDAAPAEVAWFGHGTTVATNALLEHKGARLGLLTTEGHRDVVEMREGLKDDRYNLRMPPPEQLDRKSTRLNSSHSLPSRMPSSA